MITYFNSNLKRITLINNIKWNWFVQFFSCWWRPMDIDGNLGRQSNIAIVISFLSALCLLETWLIPMGQTASWECLPRSCQTDIGHGYAHSLHVASCGRPSLSWISSEQIKRSMSSGMVREQNRGYRMNPGLHLRGEQAARVGWAMRGGESPSGKERSGRTQVSPSTIDLYVPLHISLPGLTLISRILHIF